MDLTSAVMAALRITTNDAGIAEEVKTLIRAAESDLTSTGIKKPEDETADDAALFRQAVIVYCKANFGLDNPEAERFTQSYELMKWKLMNTKEFKNAL